MAIATPTEIDRSVPGEKSSRPLLALLLGWLVPGAGHIFLGKYIRGGLLFVSILGMFLVGLGMQGKIYTPNSGEILDMLGFAGQLGLGALFGLAHIFGWGATTVLITVGDWGTKFIVVAGLLNLISAVDAHSLANGRKAS
ncbi:MAG: hypothetical protein M3R43_00530 [Acidobacteriota bacterium]|nr:hypothetical protein [Acidobacteriota bacterium]